MLGAGALLLFLIWLLFLRGGDEDEPVELGTAPPSASVTPVQPLPPAPLPTMVAPPPLAAPAPVAPTPGLTLHGVSGGGPGGGAALIQYQGGNQRLVRVGREIALGMVLKSVGPSHAIASSSGGDVRFDLNRTGTTAVAAAPVVAPGPAPVPPVLQAERAETIGLRLGLEPVREGGRVSGYTVRPGAGLSRLAAAGLQAGDRIMRVNGSELDEERLLELSSQMSSSTRMDLDVVRGGREIKLTFAPQQLR